MKIQKTFAHFFDILKLANIRQNPLLATVGLIILDLCISIYLSLFSVMITPLILNLISLFNSFLADKRKPFEKCLFTCIFISIHDIIIRIFAEDFRGKDAAVFISGIIKFNVKESIFQKILAISLFPILMLFHFVLVGKFSLGMT